MRAAERPRRAVTSSSCLLLPPPPPVCFVYLHAAAKWLLAVLVTTSGWHSEPGNQAAGKLGGSAPNGLLKIIPKIIPQNYAIPVWPCPLMGLGKRECVGQRSVCVCCGGRDLDGATLVSVSWSVYFLARVCVCVCSVMILAVLVHWGNGAC